MDIVTVSIDDLELDPNNARRHSKKNLDAIAGSLKAFGQRKPIVVWRNRVVAGNGTLVAARSLGWKEISVARCPDDWDEVRVKAFALADNRSAELAEWDEQVLTEQLRELELAEFDVEAIGFEAVVEPEPVVEDELPEVVDTRVKLGQVWQLGRHRLMCGDSTDVDTLNILIKDKQIDMVWTDPPYGIGLDKQNQKLGKSQNYRAVLNDHDNSVAIQAFELIKTIKIKHLFFWGANHYSTVFPPSSCWIVWDKQGGKHVTYADIELCYSNLDSPARLFTHIWDGFRRDSEQGEVRIHATQKPIQLIIDIWKFFEKNKLGQNVLDLFGGSGSTLIACEQTGRTCFMMELDPKYCDVIIARWEKLTGETAVLVEG